MHEAWTHMAWRNAEEHGDRPAPEILPQFLAGTWKDGWRTLSSDDFFSDFLTVHLTIFYFLDDSNNRATANRDWLGGRCSVGLKKGAKGDKRFRTSKPNWLVTCGRHVLKSFNHDREIHVEESCLSFFSFPHCLHRQKMEYSIRVVRQKKNGQTAQERREARLWNCNWALK